MFQHDSNLIKEGIESNNTFIEETSLYEKFLFKKVSKVQIYLFLSASFCACCDALCLGLLNLLSLFITDKYNITLIQKGYINSISFLGVVISCGFIGKLTERYTRRNIILISLANLILFTFLAQYASSAFSFTIYYFICGVCLGPLYTLHVSTVSEIFCVSYRWFAIINVWTFYYIADLYLNVMILLFVKELNVNNWNKYFHLVELSYICVFIFCFYNLKDSPRFLFLKGKKEEGLNILSEIQNTQIDYFKNSQTNINTQKEFDLIKDKIYDQVVNNQCNSENKSFKDLFSNAIYFKSLVFLTSLVSIYLIIFISFKSIFPILLKEINLENNDSNNDNITSSNFILYESIKNALFLIPCNLICGILGENAHFSRIKVALNFSIFSLIFVFIAIFNKENLAIYSGLMLFGIVISVNTAYGLIPEIFPTSLRDKAMGLINTFARGLSSISMILILWLYTFGFSFIMIFLLVLTIVVIYLCYVFPIDTRNLGLDTIK